VLTRDHTVLAAIHTFIHKWYEPYLPLLPSHRASLPFGWYSFHCPRRLSLAAFPHYCTDPDVTWGNDREYPLVVHYWADLQSVHSFRFYDNTHVCKLIALYTANAYSAECYMSATASACTRSMAGCTDREFVTSAKKFPNFNEFSKIKKIPKNSLNARV